MKNKLKGFTIIELIVVMVIIAVLAAILVPSMMGFMTNARAAKLNGNAKIVYTAAQLALTDASNSGTIVFNSNCIYTGSSDGIGHPNTPGNDCDLTLALGEAFNGYFAFVTSDGGYNCSYAIWSEKPINATDVAQLTEQEVKDSVGTALPRGCYPLKDN